MPTLLRLRGVGVADVSCGVIPIRGDAGGELPLSTKPSSITVVVIVGFLFATFVAASGRVPTTVAVDVVPFPDSVGENHAW